MYHHYRYWNSTTGGIVAKAKDSTELITITESIGDIKLEGRGGTGKDVQIKANQTNAYPYIYLHGNSAIEYNTNNELWINKQGTRINTVAYASNVTDYRGGSVSGDALKFRASSADTFPYLVLTGNSDIEYYLPTTGVINFLYNSVMKQRMGSTGEIFIAETTTPTAVTNYGAIYTKNDNKLYFQDGAGAEHEVAFV